MQCPIQRPQGVPKLLRVLPALLHCLRNHCAERFYNSVVSKSLDNAVDHLLDGSGSYAVQSSRMIVKVNVRGAASSMDIAYSFSPPGMILCF